MTREIINIKINKVMTRKKRTKEEQPLTTEVVGAKKKSPKKKKAVEEKKAVPAKKAAAPKKETAKKAAPAKKEATVKAATKVSVNLQFAGKEYKAEDFEKMAKDVWQYDLGNKAADLKSVDLYVKPEENKVYYVMNGDVTGDFDI